MEGLSNGSSKEVELGSEIKARMDGLKALVLVAAPAQFTARKNLIKVPASPRELPSFRWENSTAGWKRAVGLVSGLIDPGEPGHQYFTDEEKDDALVEIAFREYRPPDLW